MSSPENSSTSSDRNAHHRLAHSSLSRSLDEVCLNETPAPACNLSTSRVQALLLTNEDGGVID
jgi:hypothetical protein